MEELLKFLLKKLTSKPESIKISKAEEDDFVTFTVNLAEEDKGKIIGKEGRNIKAIRQLLSILARDEQKRIMINVE